MPVISRFFGIAVYMYWRDHAPAHFHARYQDDEVTVEIGDKWMGINGINGDGINVVKWGQPPIYESNGCGNK